MFAGRNTCTTKHTFQSASYISVTDCLPDPGGECKQICVGCQLPSLLKDKDSIWRMCSSDAPWPGRPPGQTRTLTHRLMTTPASLSLYVSFYLFLSLIRSTIVPSLQKHPSPALPANLWPCVSTDLRAAGGYRPPSVHGKPPHPERAPCPQHRIKSLYVWFVRVFYPSHSRTHFPPSQSRHYKVSQLKFMSLFEALISL